MAVCLLFSFVNPVHEQIITTRCAQAGLMVSLSSDVLPEFREYERSSTTAVNAYVGPLMEAYLAELGRAQRFQIAIMQSNGGFLSSREARRHAVRTVLSLAALVVFLLMR